MVCFLLLLLSTGTTPPLPEPCILHGSGRLALRRAWDARGTRDACPAKMLTYWPL